MRWFVNLSTRAKLLFGFGLLLVLLIVVIVTAYTGLTTIQQSQATLYRENFQVAWETLQIRALQNEQQAEVLRMMLMADRSAHAASERELRKRAEEIDERMQRLMELGRNDANFFRGLEEFKTTLEAYRQTRTTQIKLIHDGKNDEAMQLSLGIQHERFEKFKAIARELGDQVQVQARAAIQQSEEKAHQAVLIFVVVGLLAILFGVVLVWVLNRNIASRLAVFMQFVERVGRGDLTQPPVMNGEADNRGRNEVARLGYALNQMVAGLKELTGQTRQVTKNLNSAAAEIMASIQQQAGSTKEQAATVQQITATMNEVAQSGAQISDRAKQVAAAAETTSTISNAGMESVQDTTRTMESIRTQVEEVAEQIVALSEKTQAVGEIVGTVNDIAERSNLLALNAAIEAAAAGEQGSRFAVVANEMKNLADQAKESTVQVRTIRLSAPETSSRSGSNKWLRG